MAAHERYLIIRLGAIGDLLLTTPVIRSLKRAKPQAEIHLLVKPQFRQVLATNPHLTAIHTLQGSLWRTAQLLRPYRFTHMLDLHKNLRSHILRLFLLRPTSTFDKRNALKLQMTRSRRKPRPHLQVDHLVPRYAQALQPLGIQLDEAGLEYPVPPEAQNWAQQFLGQELGPALQDKPPIGLVLGATWATKRWLPAYWPQLIRMLQEPVVLLGGAAEQELAESILQALKADAGQSQNLPVANAVGKSSWVQSAALVQACRALVSPDTGLMHLGAALQVPQVTLWGSTVPEMGMTPFRSRHIPVRTLGLKCQPCSRIGFAACPQGHFRCMRENTPQRVLEALRLMDAWGWTHPVANSAG